MADLSGHLMINGVDVYRELGAFILKGGEYSLLTIPTRKESVMTAWPEFSLVDVDLSNPVYAVKSFTLQIGMRGATAEELKLKEAALVALVIAQPVTIFVRSLNITVSARYVSASPRYYANTFVDLTITFVMDEPMQWLNGSAVANNAGLRYNGNTIGGVDISTLGMRITRESNYRVWAELNQPQTSTNEIMSGQVVDLGKDPTFAAGDINIHAIINGTSVESLKGNLRVLKQLLNADKYLLIYLKDINKTLWTSYKSMSVKSAYLRSPYCVEFSLSMMCYFTAIGQQPDEGYQYNENEYLNGDYAADPNIITS